MNIIKKKIIQVKNNNIFILFYIFKLNNNIKKVDYIMLYVIVNEKKTRLRCISVICSCYLIKYKRFALILTLKSFNIQFNANYKACWT